ARGDGGAPGVDRRREPPAARSVPRVRDAEPHRARGDLHAPRGAARPIPAEAHDPRAGAGGRGRRAAPARRRLPPARARCDPPGHVARRHPRGAGIGGRRERDRRRARLYRRPRARDARRGVGRGRREPPRGRGPARGGEGLGLARRLSRHHARPRAGDARARVAPPHPAAPRCRDRGRHDRSDPRERRSDDPRPALMYVTGRLPLLLAAGVVPLVVLGAAGASPWAVLAIWILLVAAVVLIEGPGSPRPDSIEISRDVPARARLGDAVPTRLQLINTGERTVRARVRDGWQPTAGSAGERYAVTIPARESRT